MSFRGSRAVSRLGFHASAIHSEVACRLKALGMRLFAVRQSNWPVAMPSAEEPQAALEAFGQWTSRLDFARRADVIVLACTETPETRGVIDAKFLAHCRPGVVIINVTRGPWMRTLCHIRATALDPGAKSLRQHEGKMDMTAVSWKQRDIKHSSSLHEYWPPAQQDVSHLQLFSQHFGTCRWSP